MSELNCECSVFFLASVVLCSSIGEGMGCLDLELKGFDGV